ncbi:MAG: CoA transferase subunit A, partial [Thermoleophilia bacterium]|nr:CoA transferase subunit A [Thermoleophilia bacterium]
MISTGKVVSLAEAAAAVPDGARIAFGGGGALMRRPMAFARELLRQGRTGLHVHHMLGGLEIDLLVGGGAVASTSCAYLGLLEYGQAPSFQRAVREGAVDVAEYSEFSFIAGLRAADMGLPFLPWKTPWGSDIVTQLELRTVRDPYSDHELLALPATPLDVAVIQVDRSDEEGFVELPEEPDLIWDYDYLIARVARTTIVCAEEIAPPRTPARVALIGREVARVVEVPGGAWPAGMHPRYAPDVEHVVKTYL